MPIINPIKAKMRTADKIITTRATWELTGGAALGLGGAVWLLWGVGVAVTWELDEVEEVSNKNKM